MLQIDRVKLVSELTKQNVTQLALAKKSGLSRSTIGLIKAGKSCSDATGKKIAAALNVPIEKLI